MTKWIVSCLVALLATQSFAAGDAFHSDSVDHSHNYQISDESPELQYQDANQYFEEAYYGEEVRVMDADPLPPPPAPPTDNPPPRPTPPPTNPGNPPEYPGNPGYPPSPNPPPPVGKEYNYSIGSGELGRFKTREYTFFPRQDLNRITRIRLVGYRNEIEIKEVTVRYVDGYEERVYMLTGDLGAGRIKESWASGRAIHSIKVRASANGIFKKPGGFRVDVTAVK